MTSLLAGCSFQQPSAPSTLLIAIEEFGFRPDLCESSGGGGFETLCRESVRYTHAFTPSTMSQAALASVLTGLYPFEHSLRDNGISYLSAKFQTTAEVALKNRYRTGFFGGGPPVWRNAGLNQGFEVFDDGVVPTLQSLYRPASETIQQFITWQEQELKRRPYLALLHLVDLHFIESPTTNDLGEIRPSSFSGQLEEIDESLGSLIQHLKKTRRWDNTAIYVFGLSGPSGREQPDSRLALSMSSVQSKRTRVMMFIKPARKDRNSAVNWKIDSNVSLADLGATIIDGFGEKPPQGPLPVFSLKSSFSAPSADWPNERLLYSEAAWPKWRGHSSEVRVGLRQGNDLYIHDEQALLFDTISDGFDVNPYSESRKKSFTLREPFTSFLERQNISPWREIKPGVVQKLDLGRFVWSSRVSAKEALDRLSEFETRYPNDQQVKAWAASIALRADDWTKLKSLGEKNRQWLWMYVGARQLGERISPPADRCLQAFLRKDKSHDLTLRECPSAELLALDQWLNSSADSTQRQAAMERFLRLHADRLVLEKISEVNHVIGQTWDVSPLQPDGPKLADLILALPENQKHRQQVYRRLSISKRN